LGVAARVAAGGTARAIRGSSTGADTGSAGAGASVPTSWTSPAPAPDPEPLRRPSPCDGGVDTGSGAPVLPRLSNGAGPAPVSTSGSGGGAPKSTGGMAAGDGGAAVTAASGLAGAAGPSGRRTICGTVSGPDRSTVGRPGAERVGAERSVIRRVSTVDDDGEDETARTGLEALTDAGLATGARTAAPAGGVMPGGRVRVECGMTPGGNCSGMPTVGGWPWPPAPPAP